MFFCSFIVEFFRETTDYSGGETLRRNEEQGAEKDDGRRLLVRSAGWRLLRVTSDNERLGL